MRTATGPGGISGPLRVDLEGRYSYNVMAVRLPPPAGFSGIASLMSGIKRPARVLSCGV